MGVGVVVKTNLDTGAVWALLAARGELPILAPVTETEMALPRWAEVSVNVLPVAPEMSTPSSCH